MLPGRDAPTALTALFTALAASMSPPVTAFVATFCITAAVCVRVRVKEEKAPVRRERLEPPTEEGAAWRRVGVDGRELAAAAAAAAAAATAGTGEAEARKTEVPGGWGKGVGRIKVGGARPCCCCGSVAEESVTTSSRRTNV